MDEARESVSHDVGGGRTADATTDPSAPEIDLDRLVWDPEYRTAMRPWLAG